MAAADSLHRESGQKIDHLLIELRKDAEELRTASGLRNSGMIQEGISDVAEVIAGLERLRQLLIKC
jgi:hypothetical protein